MVFKERQLIKASLLHSAIAVSDRLLSEDILQAAYRDAIAFFTQELTKDECKRIWLEDKPDIGNVVEVLQMAKLKYEQRSRPSRARAQLKKFSGSLMYYGAIMDTLSQHHPEYVSLVWGAVKFVFIGILNHEELTSTFAKALAEIADVLPRAEIKLKLYSTPAMRDAVAQLFAHIIRFVQRAVKWYNAGKLKHVYHAFVHPSSLTYSDLIQTISKHAQRVEKLAAEAAQAEQRDIHNTLIEVKQLMLDHQTLNSSKLISVIQYVQQIQYMQIAEFAAKSVLPNPHNSLQHYRVMAIRRRARCKAILDEVRSCHSLQEWGGVAQSAILVVKGSFRTAQQARDLAVDVISLVQSAGVPVAWVLNDKRDEDAFRPFVADVFKLLAHQVMQINTALRDTRLDAMKFQAARTESDWIEILVSLFQGLPELYIILDAQVLEDDVCEVPQWISLFSGLFEHLRRHSITTVVKVGILSYRKDYSKLTGRTTEYLVDLSKIKGQAVEKGQLPSARLRRKWKRRHGNKVAFESQF